MATIIRVGPRKYLAVDNGIVYSFEGQLGHEREEPYRATATYVLRPEDEVEIATGNYSKAMEEGFRVKANR